MAHNESCSCKRAVVVCEAVTIQKTKLLQICKQHSNTRTSIHGQCVTVHQLAEPYQASHTFRHNNRQAVNVRTISMPITQTNIPCFNLNSPVSSRARTSCQLNISRSGIVSISVQTCAFTYQEVSCHANAGSGAGAKAVAEQMQKPPRCWSTSPPIKAIHNDPFHTSQLLLLQRRVTCKRRSGCN